MLKKAVLEGPPASRPGTRTPSQAGSSRTGSTQPRKLGWNDFQKAHKGNQASHHLLLTWAARHGQAEAARLLLEAGAATDQADAEGCTPLYVASQEGQVECARLLLEAGAAIEQPMDDGTTPLAVAYM